MFRWLRIGSVWVGIALIWASLLLLVLVRQTSAQMLDPTVTVHAYMTADPNNPDRLGLATPDGRFSVTPVQGCDWLADGDNVLMWPNAAVPPWLALSGTDASEPGCFVHVEGKRDNTPCFVNAADECDHVGEEGE